VDDHSKDILSPELDRESIIPNENSLLLIVTPSNPFTNTPHLSLLGYTNTWYKLDPINLILEKVDPSSFSTYSYE